MTTTELAEAHILTVQQSIQQLMQERQAIDQKIAQLQQYVSEAAQVVELAKSHESQLAETTQPAASE
jgi:hypothetical protein